MALPDELNEASDNLQVISDIVNGPAGNVLTPSGRVHQTLTSILGTLAAEGNVYPPEVIAQLSAIESDISDLASQIADLVAPADSAYAAQQAEIAAEAADVAVRLSVAMTMPDNFIEGNRYWTNQMGEGQPIQLAADMPLPGTFENVTGRGRVYKTEASPVDDNSFATLGVVRGIAGKRVILEAAVSALDINSSGGEHSRIGVALVALNEDFTVREYLAGGNSYDFLEPSAGVVKIRYDYVMPNDPAPWYRMRLYYNFNEGTGAQGNQQFLVDYLHTEQLLPTEFQYQPTNPALTDISEATPGEGDILQRQSGHWIAVGAEDFVQSLVDLEIFAPTANPDFTGTPLSAAPAPEANSRQIATTAWVKAITNGLKGSPPSSLDSLQKLASAVGNNPTFSTAVSDALALRQPLDSDLTAIAALTTQAFGRSLLTAADATAAKTLLEVSGGGGGSGVTAIPTVTHLTSGSGNFTPPASCRYLEVYIKGAGGGGAGSGTTPGNGGDGGDTTFGDFTAGGGKGAAGTNGGAGGAPSGGSGGVRHSGQAGGSATGGYTFAPGGKGGGAKGALVLGSQAGANAPSNSGCGGAGVGADSVAASGGGGGEGADLVVVISTPTADIAYSIGAAGTVGAAGTSGQAGGAGGSGEIIIKAFT